jgi:hypothetical protein
MNSMIILAGVASGITTIGHFSLGYKMYVLPMLRAEIDPVAKRVMLCVYHYMSVFLSLATISMLWLGYMIKPGMKYNMLFLFLGTCFALMAIVQLILALTSRIPRGIWKMFQWVLFALVAILTFMGC